VQVQEFAWLSLVEQQPIVRLRDCRVLRSTGQLLDQLKAFLVSKLTFIPYGRFSEEFSDFKLGLELKLLQFALFTSVGGGAVNLKHLEVIINCEVPLQLCLT
jgi:hypothetical protein